MHSKLIISVTRWFSAAIGLGGIVFFFHVVLQVNPTTVALTLLLFIHSLASRWGLRYAVVISFAAGACYNYFFLPPVGHFIISDPQNIVALLVFLITSIFASRMSERIREESKEARASKAELEILYRLSRALLQTDEFVQLTKTVPNAVAVATGAQAVLFFLLDGNRIYRFGSDWTPHLSEDALKELSHAPGIISSAGAQEAMIPLRSGVRPRGILIIRGLTLSHQSLDALGGLVSIALDRSNAIDEVSRTEAAKENERLRALMLDSITHELGAPLAFIDRSLDSLLAQGLEPAESRALLGSVQGESNRLSRLVAQAVEMAKFDTQELRMTFVPQSMEEMINDAIQTAEDVLKGHPVQVTLAPRLPSVQADSIWVGRLLTKLLQNAAKYSPDDAPIFITAEQDGRFVTCSIADRGIGIEPIEQSFIFDKFLRSGNREQRSSGTGLGLAICRTIVEAHGGKIEVSSQPGRGSVFSFTLRV
ncbi:ATP-binding protein [Granulicella tundricola]|uniref:histidine kinase n=1 Tax=Granulicella tundricola (strain ATCC BAA-1859 / DSM 23138 / MP5ACTX9) TaxID=1198114 RepID=E8X5C3_GRATM|nr:ATP-binding protein [Granulicella tundricola]ADW69470.1 integral membrane sensor signal transduction histidine kinase [Granulicella tundricola MP5ACTX9]